jgi:hypothetical protein
VFTALTPELFVVDEASFHVPEVMLCRFLAVLSLSGENRKQAQTGKRKETSSNDAIYCKTYNKTARTHFQIVAQNCLLFGTGLLEKR